MVMRPTYLLVLVFLVALILIIYRLRVYEGFTEIEPALPYSDRLSKTDIVNLKKGQDKMTNMLRVFDRICRKYGLKYWCCGGTLLGVIRHQGWVPWDGDIDVSMLEGDYAKLTEVIQRELPKTMWFQSSKTDPLFRREEGNINYLPSKIREINSCYLHCQDGEKWHNGLQLDIFVFRQQGHVIKAPFQGVDIRDVPYEMIFPLGVGKFHDIEVYIPNKVKDYSIMAWGEYPPKLLEVSKRYPHEGLIDPDTTCPFHLEKYPDLIN